MLAITVVAMTSGVAASVAIADSTTAGLLGLLGSSTTTTTSSTTTTTPTTTPPPTTTSTTATPDQPCGPTLAKSTGGSWVCTLDDEFNGTSLNRALWTPQVSATTGYMSGTDACFVDTPNNISVSGGTLNLTARKEAAPFNCGGIQTQYTSGMVSTYGAFGQAYGRFEARAKMPAATVAGLQSSLWLWPVDPKRYGSSWPASGEIDWAEAYSQYPDRAIPYIHYNAAAPAGQIPYLQYDPNQPDPNVTNNYCYLGGGAGTFHTYAVEWTTSTIKVSYDGQVCLTDSWNPASPLVKPQPFDQPFIICLTQALGIGSNQFDPSKTPLPATTQIDYMRVWK